MVGRSAPLALGPERWRDPYPLFAIGQLRIGICLGKWRRMIGQVQEDGTLICQADTDLSIVPTYRRVPSSRFEAESTTVVNADGEVINGNIVQDELASGGAYMGSTGGKGFILESTTQQTASPLHMPPQTPLQSWYTCSKAMVPMRKSAPLTSRLHRDGTWIP